MEWFGSLGWGPFPNLQAVCISGQVSLDHPDLDSGPGAWLQTKVGPSL